MLGVKLHAVIELELIKVCNENMYLQIVWSQLLFDLMLPDVFIGGKFWEYRMALWADNISYHFSHH